MSHTINVNHIRPSISDAELARLRKAHGYPPYGVYDQPSRPEPKPSPKGRAANCVTCGKMLLTIARKVKPEHTHCRRERMAEKRLQALVLREGGWTIRKISRTLKAPEATVHGWVVA